MSKNICFYIILAFLCIWCSHTIHTQNDAVYFLEKWSFEQLDLTYPLHLKFHNKLGILHPGTSELRVFKHPGFDLISLSTVQTIGRKGRVPQEYENLGVLHFNGKNLVLYDHSQAAMDLSPSLILCLCGPQPSRLQAY